jgi:hypothetical protein
MLIGRMMMSTGMPTRPGLDGRGGSNPLRPTNQGLITGPLIDATEETGGSQLRIDEPKALSGALVEMVRDLEGRVLLDVTAENLGAGSLDLDLRALRKGLNVRAPRKLRVP